MDIQTDASGRNPESQQSCMIVVPCYNEAARLMPDRYSEFLAENPGIHFLFVNDGSSDATLSILDCLSAKHPGRVHLLDKQPNAGKAEAVRAGMLDAMRFEGTAVIGFWDADLATPLSVIPQLLAILSQRPELDIVLGSRVHLLGYDIRRRAVRHYLGRCFATVVSVMLKLPIYDSQCGAKLFRNTPDLREILAAEFQSKWIFDVELLARFIAVRNQDRQLAASALYEYPLPRWEDVAGSKVGPLDFLTAFADLLKIWRSLD